MKWIHEWRKDVKELEAKVRDIKSRLRKDWTQYPRDTETYFCNWTKTVKTRLKFTSEKDQLALLVLKFDLTHMYQYRAVSKGKTHCPKMPPAATYQQTIPDFTKYDKLRVEEEITRSLQKLADLEIVGDVGL